MKSLNLWVSLGLLASGCALAGANDEASSAGSEIDEAPAPPSLRSLFAGARTTGRPQLAFTTSPSATDSVLEICRDRDCAEVVATAEGTSTATFGAPLPRGSYFLRGRGRRVIDATHATLGAPTPARVFFSNGRDAVSTAALGLVSDFDGDGKADLFRIGSSDSEYRLSVTRASGETSSVTGGDPYRDGAFGSYVRPVPDIDGDGRTELVTVERLRDAQGNPVIPLRVLRYQLGADQKLALAQTVELAETSAFRDLLSLGDVDRDGYADVGVVRALPARLEVGPGGGTLAYGTGVTVEILFGGPAGFDRSLARRRVLSFRVPQAEQPYSQSEGIQIQAIGDMNGDGYPELALGNLGRGVDGEPYSNSAETVVVYAGSQDVTYTQSLARFTRWSLPVALGDVNGDGLADLGGVQQPAYIRAAGSSLAGLDPARVMLVAGAAGELAAKPLFTLAIDDVPGCSSGWSYYYSKYPRRGLVAGGGDLDGDGFDDVVLGVGSTHEGTGEGFHHCDDTGGRALVFYGDASGLGAEPAQTIARPVGPFPAVRFLGDIDPRGSDEVLIGDVFSGPRGVLEKVRSL